VCLGGGRSWCSSSSSSSARTRLYTVRDHAFDAVAARDWNSLPSTVTSIATVSSFKSHPKTHLFHCCVHSSWPLTQMGVFPFRRIPFRRVPCKLFFPSFSFLIPFINAIQIFMGVNEMPVKNITFTVSVRVSVTVRVSLVWRHQHFFFRKISTLHGFSGTGIRRIGIRRNEVEPSNVCLQVPCGCPVVQLKVAGDDGFGVYVVCRTVDALSRFVSSNVSRQFSRVVESVFSALSRQKIVVVQLNWIKDYQSCARRIIDAGIGRCSSLRY